MPTSAVVSGRSVEGRPPGAVTEGVGCAALDEGLYEPELAAMGSTPERCSALPVLAVNVGGKLELARGAQWVTAGGGDAPLPLGVT